MGAWTSGSYTKFMYSSAAGAFGAPTGITMLSVQSMQPSSGMTHSASRLEIR